MKTSEPASLRGDWAAFLMAQMVFGLGWSGAFTGVEWSLGHTQIDWGAPLLAALAFITGAINEAGSPASAALVQDIVPPEHRVIRVAMVVIKGLYEAGAEEVAHLLHGPHD